MNASQPSNVQPTNRVPRSGTRLILYVAFADFALATLFALSCLAFRLTVVPFSAAVGVVLITFGLFKIAIAVDAICAPPAVAPQSDRRQETGSAFRVWVAYKLTPAALALVAGTYLLIVGAAALDGLTRSVP